MSSQIKKHSRELSYVADIRGRPNDGEVGAHVLRPGKLRCRSAGLDCDGWHVLPPCQAPRYAPFSGLRC